MSGSIFDNSLKSINAFFEEFQIAYENATAEDKSTCQLLLEVAGELIAIGASMAVNPNIVTIVLKVVLSGNITLNVFEISKRVFNYFKSITDDREFRLSIESDIKLLEEIKEDIKGRVKDLGDRIVKQLILLKSILTADNSPENQLKFSEFIGEFNYLVHMISVDIERCQALLSSIETKINASLNVRMGFVIGGSVTSGVAGAGTIGVATATALLLTNPITAIIGVVGAVVLAGTSVAGGVVAGVQDARRRSEMERMNKLQNIKAQLIDFQKTIKSHVEKLNKADIPVDNNFK